MAMRSSCEAISTISPALRTMILDESRMVARRWAMDNHLAQLANFGMYAKMWHSVFSLGQSFSTIVLALPAW